MLNEQSGYEAWKQSRLQDLTSEWGWLTLTGLFWLKQGNNSIGSAQDSSIVIPGTLDQEASMVLSGNEVQLWSTPQSGLSIQGIWPGTMTTLVTDAQGSPTEIRHGDHSLTVIQRSGAYAVRLKNKNSLRRLAFEGLQYHPYDERFIFEASWQPHGSDEMSMVPTSVGRLELEAYQGTLSFSHDGKIYSLQGQLTPQGSIFVNFRDLSSGKTTYGGGRFLVSSPLKDKTVNLDFNRAYNPPCSFTSFATCSRPHPSNNLDFYIPAGELSP